MYLRGMNRAAYILRTLQRRMGKRLFIELFDTGSGHVYGSDDVTVFTFANEAEYYEQAKKYL